MLPEPALQNDRPLQSAKRNGNESGTLSHRAPPQNRPFNSLFVPHYRKQRRATLPTQLAAQVPHLKQLELASVKPPLARCATRVAEGLGNCDVTLDRKSSGGLRNHSGNCSSRWTTLLLTQRCFRPERNTGTQNQCN